MPSARDIQKARRQLGKDRMPAQLGNGSGQPRTPDGLYWVQKKEADGLAAAIKLPLAAGLSMKIGDGVPCEIGYDENENQVIFPASGTTLATAGINPQTLNPLDAVIQNPIKTTDFPPFLCVRHGDTVNFPLTVVVYVPPVANADGTVILPTILQADLSSFVPAADLRCFAVVFWLDDNTLEVQSSTPVSMLDPLTNADLEECIAAATAGAIPIWAWILQDAQTELSADPAKNLDMRQFINMATAGGGSGITQLTGDVTAGPGSGSQAATVVQVGDANVDSFLDYTEASTPSTPASDHARQWVSDDQGFTVQKYIDAGGQIFYNGRDLWIICRNTTGSTINKGKWLSVNGQSNGYPSVTLADANNSSTNSQNILAQGVSMDTATNNIYFRLMIFGILDNLDTSAFSAGAQMWLSTTAGDSSNSIPAAGVGWAQYLGRVLVSHATTGAFQVNILPPYFSQIFASTVAIGQGSGAAGIDLFCTGGKLSVNSPASVGANRTASFPDASGNVLLDTSNLNGTNVGTGTIANARLTAMAGATLSAAGTAGYVPQPAAADDVKVLSGAATYIVARRRQFAQTADVTVASSTTETTLIGAGQGSATLAADVLRVGTYVYVTAWGYASRASGNFLLKVELGSMTLATSNTALTIAANSIVKIEACFKCVTTGATGTIDGQGLSIVNSSTVAGTSWQMVSSGGTTTVDTTGTLAVDVTAQWSVSNAGNTVTITHLNVELE